MKRFITLAVTVSAAFAVACVAANNGKKTQMDAPAAGVTSGDNASATPASVMSVALGTACFSPVEIAKTDEERARGLMNRESLPENGGMWFVFDRMGQEKFWMKDTLISLDLIYVDEARDASGKPGKVVSVIENAPAGSTEILESPEAFRYVLEVNAGAAARCGIKTGDAISAGLFSCAKKEGSTCLVSKD